MDLSTFSQDARWLDLGRGVEVLTLPLTSPVAHAARARAEFMIVQAVEGGEAISRAGAHVTGLPDMSDEVERNGVWSLFYLLSIAELTVLDWRGLTDGGQVAPFSIAGLGRILMDPGFASVFQRKQVHGHNEVVAEGND